MGTLLIALGGLTLAAVIAVGVKHIFDKTAPKFDEEEDDQK